ncbi:MAG: M55 family metallopeptidase [Desulfurococcaceae archaeon]
MKAYVSIDMEGLPGTAATMTMPWHSQFPEASRIATAIANAVASALRSHGFERVTVADSHGLMTSVSYLDLAEGVELVRGYPRPFSMLTGLDSSYSALLLIGYHAAAGTPHGFLDHTYSGRAFAEVLINGERASEFLLNAAYAGELGVPAILVAGDAWLTKEVERWAPWAVFVELKRGLSRYSASSPPLGEVRKALEEGVAEACRRLRDGSARPLRLATPLELRIRLREALVADVLEQLSFVRREGAYDLVLEARSAREALGFLEVAAMVASGVEALRQSVK